MRTKIILAAALLSVTAATQALTLEQSRGMVYAHCAGVYMAASSVAFEQNRTGDYEKMSRLLSLASDGATTRIGNSKTTDIAESSVTQLLKAYRKNPILAEDKIAKESLTCSEYFK
jgi:hypothetical protein